MMPVTPGRLPPAGAPAGLPGEPPMYRPFALLAFGSTVIVGTPIGLWAVGWLYLGWPAVPAPWLTLHAHAQVFGFFATLIPGIAQHLLPRFTGRPFTRPPLAPWLAATLGAALALRITGTAFQAPPTLAVAALLQTAGFAGFALWVWRSLDPPPLRLVRVHLTLASGWLAAACALETALRIHASAGAGPPGIAGLRAVHAVGLLGGVVGWILGVLLRAGPMFVAGWRVPPPVARAVPAALAVASVAAAAGEMGPWDRAAGAAVTCLADALGLATILAVAASAGFRVHPPRTPPIVSRSPAEARIFRLAVGAAAAALVAMLAAAAVAASGGPAHVITDAARHLFTVGFLTSVVVAMTFRLIPVLERVALPWPRLRDVAFFALLGALTARTAEVLVAHAWPALAPLVLVSGALVWIALAAVAANLGGAMTRRTRVSGGRP
jgi:hypothetical protein